MKIGDNIKKLRIKRGLTQSQLADRVAVRFGKRKNFRRIK
jgi:transcriptional regulator with XRE-family HTH domain